jgi:hypothetical protein
MIFRALDDHLHEYAKAAARYFSKEYNVKGIKAEVELDHHIAFRPTLSGTYPDKHLLCVEVAEVALPPEIQRFVLDCRSTGLPARIWVAVRKGSFDHVSTHDLTFFRTHGVGLIEIDDKNKARILEGPPLSQSVAGLRAIKVSEFPSGYRASLRSAHDTFTRGNPAKGSSEIYDELEALTRRIAVKAATISKGLKKQLDQKVEKAPWAAVLEHLRDDLNSSTCCCPDLNKTLINRIHGITEYRNATGHKPKSVQDLLKRDRQLRTRFESAVDELQSLILASAPMRP